jgi:hypothetical protein
LCFRMRSMNIRCMFYACLCKAQHCHGSHPLGSGAVGDSDSSESDSDTGEDPYAAGELHKIRCQWQEAHDDVAKEEDIVQERNGDVVTWRIGAERLARMSVIRPGQPSESISLYCYMRKCQICRRPGKFPGVDEITAWVRHGLKLPRGPASKQRHIQDLPSCG